MNRNVVTINVSGRGLSTTPSTGSLKLVNKVKQADYNQIWAARARGKDVITVNGVAKMTKPAQTTLTINDPVRFAGSAFYRLLNKRGVDIRGQWRTVNEGIAANLSGKTLLFRHYSPRLRTLVERVNVESDNLLAQHIFKRLGASLVGYGTVKNSEAVVRDYFKDNNIPDTGIQMVDGSGLSEKNKIAPYQLVHTLRAVYKHPTGQLYIDSLPAPGEGTLKNRLGGVLVRAKTGTLNNHSGLSGFVVTAKNETVGFSILVNDVGSTWPATVLQDKLVKLVSKHNRRL